MTQLVLNIENNEIIFNPNRLKIHQKISYIKEEPKKERKLIIIFDIPHLFSAASMN